MLPDFFIKILEHRSTQNLIYQTEFYTCILFALFRNYTYIMLQTILPGTNMYKSMMIYELVMRSATFYLFFCLLIIMRISLASRWHPGHCLISVRIFCFVLFCFLSNEHLPFIQTKQGAAEQTLIAAQYSISVCKICVWAKWNFSCSLHCLLKIIRM